MRILSGIQPSGALHLGNYFGMIRPALEMEKSGECFYFIADYHALTSVRSPEVLRRQVEQLTGDFLACGFDLESTVFYRQSAIPEVHELAWMLSNLAPMGLLERCHSYKDKIAKGLKPNHGLFAYPVLMAADILICQADQVPVGRDQKQHVEVARDLALKFNDAFGDVLKIAEPVIRDETAVLPGIDGQKMSKSYQNAINVFGSEKDFRKRVMSIQTDSTPIEDPKPMEHSTLLALARATNDAGLVGTMVTKMQDGGIGYGELKKILFEGLWEFFRPVRERRAALEKDPGVIEAVLASGEARAREVAVETMRMARKAVGIR